MLERLLEGSIEADPVVLAGAVGLFTVAILARLARDAWAARRDER